MAYSITEKCTTCGKCKEVCPVEAIAEGKDMFKIDPETCVNCGQCVDECPSEAIIEA